MNEEAVALLSFAIIEKGFAGRLPFYKVAALLKLGNTSEALTTLEHAMQIVPNRYPAIFKIAPQFRNHPEINRIIDQYLSK